MPSYLVQLPAGMPGLTLALGHDSMVIEAATGAEAIVVAQGYYDGPEGDVFAAATATEIDVAADLSPIVNDAGGTMSYKLVVTIVGPDTNATFEYSALAGESYDELFDGMVLLLNAHADIAGAAHSNPLFTVAAIGDDIGDHTITVDVYLGQSPVIASFVGAIVHEGIAGAVLTAASIAAPVLPSYVALKR